jgi:hypothetical protein
LYHRNRHFPLYPTHPKFHATTNLLIFFNNYSPSIKLPLFFSLFFLRQHRLSQNRSYLPQYPTICHHFTTILTAVSRPFQRTPKFHATTNLLIFLVNYSPFINMPLFFSFFSFSFLPPPTQSIVSPSILLHLPPFYHHSDRAFTLFPTPLLPSRHPQKKSLYIAAFVLAWLGTLAMLAVNLLFPPPGVVERWEEERRGGVAGVSREAFGASEGGSGNVTVAAGGGSGSVAGGGSGIMQHEDPVPATDV